MTICNHVSKAVIVTNARMGEETQHIGADDFRFSHIQRGALEVLRDGKVVALYAAGRWDSVTFAEVPNE